MNITDSDHDDDDDDDDDDDGNNDEDDDDDDDDDDGSDSYDDNFTCRKHFLLYLCYLMFLVLTLGVLSF